MEPTRMRRCSTHRCSTPIVMGLAALALAGAHTAAASAAGTSSAALPGPWHSQASGGSVLRVTPPGPAAMWRLRAGSAPAHAHIIATVRDGTAVIVSTRVRVAGAPLRGGRRAVVTLGSRRGPRLQVGVASGAAGGKRWAVWRQSGSGAGRLSASTVRVMRGRLQHLTISASATSVVVRVDGRSVARGRSALMRSVSRRHIVLGLAPGPGRGNLLVARPSARVVAPRGPRPVKRVPAPVQVTRPDTSNAVPAPLGPSALTLAASDRPYDPSASRSTSPSRPAFPAMPAAARSWGSSTPTRPSRR